MNFEGYYVQAWRNKNEDKKDKRIRLPLKMIKLVEPVHEVLPDDLKERIMRQLPQNDLGSDGVEQMVRYHQYRVVVRKISDKEYGLVSGLRSFLALKAMSVQYVNVFVAEAKSRDDWFNELQNKFTIKPIVPTENIVINEKKVKKEAVMNKIRYLVKNGQFDSPVVVKVGDEDTLIVIDGDTNAYAAKQMGLGYVRVLICPDSYK